MSRRVGLAVVLGFLTLSTIGRAQYAGDGYAPAPPPPPPLMPFNPAVGFNPTMSPEWQQMMMQKMAAQEQAAFQQQVQVYQAWAKANPKEAAALEKSYRAQMDPNAGSVARRKKKIAATKTATTPTTKGAKPLAKGAKPPADADAEEATTKAPATGSPAAPAASTTSKLRSSRQGTAKAAAPK